MDNQNSIMVAPQIPMPRDDDDEDEGLEESAAERVLSLLKTNGENSDGKVFVYRKGADGIDGLCDSFPAMSFTADSFGIIKRRFGAGEYLVRLMGYKPGGKKFVRLGETLLRIEADLAPDAATAGIQAPQAPAVDPLMLRVLQSLDAISLRLSAPPPTAPAVDPLQAMQSAVAMVTGIMAAIPKPTPAPDPMHQFGQIIGMVEGMKKVREAIEPPVVPDDPLTAALPGLMGIIGQAMQQRQPAAPAPQTFGGAPQVQIGELPPPVAAPAAPQSQPVPDERMSVMLGYAVDYLAGQAAKNAPIAETAETAVRFCPDEVMQEFVGDNWKALIQGAAPALAPHMPYIEQVRAYIIAEMMGDDEGDDEADDEADPPSNVVPLA